MHYLTAVSVTVIALAAIVGWWHTRRALTWERAARRINEAALVREHQAASTAARRAMNQRLHAEAVLKAADMVLDDALARHYQHNPHQQEGDADG